MKKESERRSGAHANRICELLVIPLLAIMAGCAGPQWGLDAGRAFRRAGQTGRPVLVYYRSSVCPYCAKMEQRVFTEPEVRSRMDEFELLQRDFGLWQGEAARFGITDTPGFVVRRASGSMVGSAAVGDMSPAEFRAFLAAARLQK